MDQAVQLWPLTAYSSYVLALSASIYGAFKFIGGHLSDDTKAQLTLWLEGSYDSTWARQFCTWFDYVFGGKHLSWSCFLRSCIASIACVLLIYLLLGPILGLLAIRLDSEISLGQVLLLGMILNLLPDYLSLYETRWLLQRFQRIRGLGVNLLLMLVDAFFSWLIIWVAIASFKGAADLKGGMGHTVGGFDITVIFFYSSFLTSALAWLYFFSSSFAKLFYRTRLSKLLEINREPENAIALVSATIVFLLGFGIQFAGFLIQNSSPEDGALKQIGGFDRFLCDWFPDTCPRIAKLTDDEIEAMGLLIQGCRGGEWQVCSDVSEKQFQADDYEVAAELWNLACEGGSARDCFNLAFLYLGGLGVDIDTGRAAKLYRRACDGAYVGGCYLLGILYRSGEGVDKDGVQAAKLFRLACDEGDTEACISLGHLYKNGDGVNRDSIQAATLFRRACMWEDAQGCFLLGQLYRGGSGFDTNEVRAAELFRKACEAGLTEGCVNLGTLYKRGRGVNEDNIQATDLYRKACEKGDAKGCALLDSIEHVHTKSK